MHTEQVKEKRRVFCDFLSGAAITSLASCLFAAGGLRLVHHRHRRLCHAHRHLWGQFDYQGSVPDAVVLSLPASFLPFLSMEYAISFTALVVVDDTSEC